MVIKAFIFKDGLIVERLVKTHYRAYIHFFKDGAVVLRGVEPVTVWVHLGGRWARECDKFLGDDMVDISVLNGLIVVILLCIELLVVVPARLDCELQRF